MKDKVSQACGVGGCGWVPLFRTKILELKSGWGPLFRTKSYPKLANGVVLKADVKEVQVFADQDYNICRKYNCFSALRPLDSGGGNGDDGGGSGGGSGGHGD